MGSLWQKFDCVNLTEDRCYHTWERGSCDDTIDGKSGVIAVEEQIAKISVI